LVGCFVYLLVGWLVGCFVYLLVGWLVGCNHMLPRDSRLYEIVFNAILWFVITVAMM
jgi:hypothetical protein